MLGFRAAGPIQSNARNGTHVVGHVALARHAIHVLAVSLERTALVGIPNGGSLRRRTGDAAIAADAKASVATRGGETDTDWLARARDGTAGTGAATGAGTATATGAATVVIIAVVVGTRREGKAAGGAPQLARSLDQGFHVSLFIEFKDFHRFCTRKTKPEKGDCAQAKNV